VEGPTLEEIPPMLEWPLDEEWECSWPTSEDWFEEDAMVGPRVATGQGPAMECGKVTATDKDCGQGAMDANHKQAAVGGATDVPQTTVT
jgi:hypothetical protein